MKISSLASCFAQVYGAPIMQRFASPLELARALQPDAPTVCFRPARLQAAAVWFRDVFPGTPFFAVKANPAPHILKGLAHAGIMTFDVASIGEVEQVASNVSGARMAFMHPVKNRRAIASAYSDYGVRAFVLDSEAELAKIIHETGGTKDLDLLVRLSVDNSGSVMPLAGKFGVGGEDAAHLIEQTRRVGARLGISFHVGSQAMEPAAWTRAIEDVASIVAHANITPEIINVGGGFPSLYPGLEPPRMDDYAVAISSALEQNGFETCEIWGEPGRALVAEAESLLARIELAKPGRLYLNDGGFGALYDAVNVRWSFPIRAIKQAGEPSSTLIPYRLHGPTCDPEDRWPEATMLPDNLEEGDWLEFGQMGAYGSTMASRFNGFGAIEFAEISDAPFRSLYK